MGEGSGWWFGMEKVLGRCTLSFRWRGLFRRGRWERCSLYGWDVMQPIKYDHDTLLPSSKRSIDRISYEIALQVFLSFSERLVAVL